MGVNADTSRSERRPGARRVEAPWSDPQFSDLSAASAGPDSGSVGPLGGDTTEDLHLRYGNAVVEAALAGGEGLYADIAADMASGIAGVSMEGGATPNHMVAARISRHAQHKSVGEVLQTLPQSSGFALDAEQRERFEEVFGHDFGHVRIHTDGVAAEASHQLYAHAFALGSDIYFAAGNFAPGTKKGDRLLAHELTHVVQHDENRLPSVKEGEDQVSSPSDPTEREAYANEKVMMAKLARLDQQGAVEADHEPGQAPGLLGQLEMGHGASLPPAVLERMMARLGEGEAAQVAGSTHPSLQAAATAMGAGAFVPQGLDEGGVSGWMASVGEDLSGRTNQLVGRLSHILGLSSGSVDVRVDGEASQRVKAEGASGLMDKGAVYLDPEAYDPETQAGRELLAHEMVHVAQEQLDVDSKLDSPGAMAEAEAQVLASDYAAGRQVSAPVMGIPETHVAADTGLASAEASPMRARYEAHRTGEEEPVQTPEQAAAMKVLTERLLQAYGLSKNAVTVRVDAYAQAQTDKENTRGLYQHGEVLLNPETFDPTTKDGRGLLAHEMTHAAQDLLTVPVHQPESSAMTGLLVEAEAELAAKRFVSGGVLGPVQVALPSDHIARETAVSAESLTGKLDAYSEQIKAFQEGTNLPGDKAAKPGGGGEENKEKKLTEFRKGVDSVADTVQELPAFDDLVEACEDADSGKKNAALSSIRGSEAYERLCNMWQGAVDGGEEAGEMKTQFKGAFSSQSSTWFGLGTDEGKKEAFAAILSAIQKDAQRNAEAEAALAAKGQADGEKENLKEGDGTEKGGDKASAGEADGNAVSAAANGDVGALMAEPVTEPVPTIEALETMSTWDAGAVQSITDAHNHQADLSTRVANGEESSRMGLVFEQVVDNFAGTFFEKGTDQLLDTLLWDNLGSKADDFLGKKVIPGVMDKLAKSKNITLKSPAVSKLQFIGPMIGLIQGGAYSADFWVGENSFYNQAWDGAGQGFEKLGNMGSLFDKIGSAESTKDAIGLSFALLADLFGGLHDIIKAVQDLVSTLSGLCYVVGGILVLLGLALIWLGAGAGLLSAGGWMIRAGGILGRISTAIEPLVLIFAGLQFLFRTLAALLVPDEMFTEQLKGVGEATNNFTEVATAKVADNVGNEMLDSLNDRKQGDQGDANAVDDSSTADEALAQNQESLDQTQQSAEDQKAVVEDLTKQKEAEVEQLDQVIEEQQNQADGEGDSSRAEDQDGGDAEQSRSRARQVLDALGAGLKRTAQGVVTDLKDVGPALKDLTTLLDVRRASGEGLAGIDTSYAMQAMEQQLPGLKERAAEMQARKAELESAIRENPETDMVGLLSPEMSELTTVASEAASLQKRVETLEQTMASIAEGQESRQRAEDTGDVEEEGLERSKDIRNDHEALQQEKSDLEVEIARVEQAESHKARAVELHAKKARLESERDLGFETPSSERDSAWHDRFDPVLAELGDVRPEYDRARNDYLVALTGSEGGMFKQMRADTDIAENSGGPLPVDVFAGSAVRTRAEVEAAIAANEEALANIDSRMSGSQEQVSSMQSQNQYVEEGSSGNATGGTGSAFGTPIKSFIATLDMLQGIGEAFGVLDGGAAAGSEESEQGEQGEQGETRKIESVGSALAAGVESLFGLSRETEADVEKLGNKHAALESMLDYVAPVDLEVWDQHQKDARAHAQKFAEAHEHAYACYQAEVAMTGQIKETEDILGIGPATLDAATQTGQGVQKGQATQNQRSSMLASGNFQVAEPDSQMSGLVADLIAKLSDHGDDVKGADAGSGSAGADASNAQSQAGATAKDTQAASMEAEDQQKQFLNEAVAMAQGAEGQTQDNMSSLEAKYSTEMQIKTQMQAFKAASLNERETERGLANENASAANAEFEELRLWADTYNAKKQVYESS